MEKEKIIFTSKEELKIKINGEIKYKNIDTSYEVFYNKEWWQNHKCFFHDFKKELKVFNSLKKLKQEFIRKIENLENLFSNRNIIIVFPPKKENKELSMSFVKEIVDNKYTSLIINSKKYDIHNSINRMESIYEASKTWTHTSTKPI